MLVFVNNRISHFPLIRLLPLPTNAPYSENNGIRTGPQRLALFADSSLTALPLLVLQHTRACWQAEKTWVEVIFRVKWKLFVSTRSYKFSQLKLIGQCSCNGISCSSCKICVNKFDSSEFIWAMLVSVALTPWTSHYFVRCQWLLTSIERPLF